MIQRASTVSALMFITALMLPACAVGVDDPDPTSAPAPSEAVSAPEEDVGEAAQAICDKGFPAYCTGFGNDGGYRCLANCSGTGWIDTGRAWRYSGLDACSYIDYGDCTSVAHNYCNNIGRSYQSACWGHR